MTWPKWTWQDVAEKQARRTKWQAATAGKVRYTRQLQSIGRAVALLMGKGLPPEKLQEKLTAYAEAVTPWAKAAAASMVQSVQRKSDQTWRAAARRWGLDIRGLLGQDITDIVARRVAENVELITSIPRKATQDVGDMAQRARWKGMRADELAKKIAARGKVSQNRARVIALTEISKTGTALTRARAERAGSEGYIWRTTRDGGRRPSHAAMEGKFVPWGQPPTLDNMTGHAGEFPN